MNKKLTYILVIISLLILFLSKFFLFERSFFGRDFSEKKILNNLFPYQYNKKYFQELGRQNPTIFSTNMGESYMRSCHLQKKLCSFFPYQQIAGDILRMRNIQYVGNDIFAAYTTGLYESLDNLTSILPYRHYPYVFGQYILPMQKNGDTSDQKTKELSREQTTRLGEKGIMYLCDENKIKEIAQQDEKEFAQAYQAQMKENSGGLYNPCKSYILPHNVGFNYYLFRNDLANASKYYKVASFSSDAPAITSQMPAIIAGRLGDHLKSMTLRYEKYKETADMLKTARKTTEQEKLAKDMERYLKKALMEYTLQLIIDTENGQSLCIHDIACLQKEGYLQDKTKEQKIFCNTKRTKTLTQTISCQILAYGIEQKYIESDLSDGSDGTLVYPLESGFIYGRRPDYNQRRIIPQIITD